MVLSVVFHVAVIFEWYFPDLMIFGCYETNFPFIVDKLGATSAMNNVCFMRKIRTKQKPKP